MTYPNNTIFEGIWKDGKKTAEGKIVTTMKTYKVSVDHGKIKEYLN